MATITVAEVLLNLATRGTTATLISTVRGTTTDLVSVVPGTTTGQALVAHGITIDPVSAVHGTITDQALVAHGITITMDQTSVCPSAIIMDQISVHGEMAAAGAGKIKGNSPLLDYLYKSASDITGNVRFVQNLLHTECPLTARKGCTSKKLYVHRCTQMNAKKNNHKFVTV